MRHASVHYIVYRSNVSLSECNNRRGRANDPGWQENLQMPFGIVNAKKNRLQSKSQHHIPQVSGTPDLPFCIYSAMRDVGPAGTSPSILKAKRNAEVLQMAIASSDKYGQKGKSQNLSLSWCIYRFSEVYIRISIQGM